MFLIQLYNEIFFLTFLGCSEYSIIPARYCYILQTDIEDSKACILERMAPIWDLFFTIDTKLR